MWNIYRIKSFICALIRRSFSSLLKNRTKTNQTETFQVLYYSLIQNIKSITGVTMHSQGVSYRLSKQDNASWGKARNNYIDHIFSTGSRFSNEMNEISLIDMCLCFSRWFSFIGSIRSFFDWQFILKWYDGKCSWICCSSSIKDTNWKAIE
jgi:hypothetical protein